jgi:hypothetical protein
MLIFIGGFALVSALALLWPAIDPGLKTFYERTFEFQADRNSPFSIWGQVEALEPLRTALIGATGVLAVFLAFRPREKSLVQVAALSAALIIAISFTMKHWFYLYIDWFYPLLLVALAALPAVREEAKPTPAAPEPSPARTNQPAPAR